MCRYLCLALTLSLLSLNTQAESAAPAEQLPADETAAQTPVPQPKAIERPQVLERSAQHAATQLTHTPLEQQQVLTTPNDTFLALWQPAHSAQATGVVILLPGPFQHADQPGVIQPLRTQLPAHGWHTLSLSLPDPYPALPVRQAVPELVKPESSTAEKPGIASPENKTEPAAEPIEQVQTEDDPEQPPHTPAQPQTDPRLEYAEQLFDRIDAALAFVKTHNPKQVILLGQDSGAYWSARYVQDRTPADVKGLIWVAATDAQAMSPPLTALLAELKQPVVDFYDRQAQAQAHQALLRKQQSVRLGSSDYRSIGLAPLANPAANEAQLVKRVRAVLTP